MKKNLAAAAAIITLFITSCKKNDRPTEPTIARLKRMERSTSHYSIITYNQQGLPTDLRFVEDGMNTLSSFTYNSAKQLASGTMENMKLTFAYGKNSIDTINMLSKTDGTLQNKVVFTYANGRVKEMVYNTKINGILAPGLKTTYEYNAAGDLVLLTNFYASNPGQFVQLEKYRYDYDTKKTALAGVRDLSYFLSINPSSHNVVKEVTYNGDNDVAEIHHYDYTYNDKDVPASARERITYPNSPEINKTIIYTYE